MILRGDDGVNVRIVCGYNPYTSRKHVIRLNYQQHMRYLSMKEKDKTCVRVWFRKDLPRQLKLWREQGDRLRVYLDTNKNTYEDQFGKTLTNEDG